MYDLVGHLNSGAPSRKHRNDYAQLLEVATPADDLRIIRTSKPANLRYRAGQSAKLELSGVRRRYSFASIPNDEWLEFFVELRPGGKFSEQLRDAKPGVELRVDGVKGKLSLQEGARYHLMVATVTGLSPLLSLLRDHWTSETSTEQRFIVLQGASYRNEFGYAPVLAELAHKHSGELLYLPTVSRPDAEENRGWDGATGRVEQWVDPVIDSLELRPTNTAIYACGQPDMVQAVKARYEAGGFVVRTEPYD
ncbi:FAD-binding oxidoreductase [Alkalilimnicola ehrlichii]|uniref:FAD-binding oxidoreductase n=1 Tax=Alkalilimnicola ehrlichii TaxID=351052 RepID=UPI0015F27B44|nr:FAD-binding oxidoreductase [Alkalilimnicola ehrlichii]